MTPPLATAQPFAGVVKANPFTLPGRPEVLIRVQVPPPLVVASNVPLLDTANPVIVLTNDTPTRFSGTGDDCGVHVWPPS